MSQFQNNIYSNTNFLNGQQRERNLVNQNYNNARNAVSTGIIPTMGFNQNVLNNSNTDISYQQNQNQNQINVQKNNFIVSSLSGQQINVEDFTLNDAGTSMQPFFGGQVKQNTKPNANRTLLEKYTGTGETYQQKTEVKNMFNMEPNVSFVNGYKAPNDKLQQRYNSSLKRNNELPFEQIRVGPGLNSGYGAEPSGGFSQFNTRDYVLPKSVEQTRTLNNPKLTYKGRVVSGLKSGQRGLIAKPAKNRPETYYVNRPEMYLRTGGGYRAAKIREKVFAKPTNRNNTRSHYGSAGPTDNTRPSKRGAYRKSTKHNYINPGPLNSTAGGRWKYSEKSNESAIGDYGKKSIEIKKNERDVTQKRTHVTNLASIVKALIAPLQDVLRTTRKENFIGNPRPSGNMNAQMPSQLTVHDPDDVARTTIKETMVHNDREGNISGPTKLTVYNPDDVARTTVKETTIHNEHEGFVTGPKRLTVYDPEDVPRTTIKETNIHNNHDGFIRTVEKMTVYDPNDVARTTIKETNIHNKAPYINMAPQGPHSLRVYDPNDIPQATTRETTENNSHLGNIERVNRLGKGGYNTQSYNAKATNKQFISDYEYSGIADGDVGKGSGRGYMAASYQAKNTHKQFLSNNEYKGGAGFHNSAQTSNANYYNARLNPNKEQIARGRAPTEQGAKVTVGQDMVNVQHRKIEGDMMNIREPGETKIYGDIPTFDRCGLTRTRDKLPEDVQRSRINPDILNAFRENPYTQRLDSTL